MKRELIAFEARGSGQTVIFVHGWNMAGSVWSRQGGFFSDAGFEAVTVDLRGHGDSAGMRPFTVAQSARDIKELVDKNNYDRPFIVGWSMGAMVAIEYALNYPDEAAGICLVGGSPRFTMTEGYPHGLPPKDLQGMKVKLKRDFERCIREFRFASTAGLSTEEKGLVEDAPATSADAAMEGLDELGSVDLRSKLGNIKVPVLLVHGTKDSVCLPGAASYMDGEIANSQMAMIEGAGHLPFLSHEEQFNDILEKFIRRI